MGMLEDVVKWLLKRGEQASDSPVTGRGPCQGSCQLPGRSGD